MSSTFVRESLIVFRRQIRMNLRNPAWVLIGIMQPVLYLLLFGPLLKPIVSSFPGAADNERLALLGDAVLALVVAEHLLAAGPAEPVGVLTPRRAALVSGENLARWARAVDLGAHLGLVRAH